MAVLRNRYLAPLDRQPTHTILPAMPSTAPSLSAAHLLLMALGAVALFAALGVIVSRPTAGPIDRALEAWALARHRPPATRMFRFLTRAGAPWNVIKFGPLVGLAVALAGWPAAGVAAALATIVAYWLYPRSKEFFAPRARPPKAASFGETSHAFPSGHSLVNAAFWMALALVLWSDGTIGTGWAVALGAAGPIAVGLSRIYLGIHWTTDVLGGWLLGAGVALLTAAGEWALRGRIHG